jgi:hypothetical protein
VAVAVVDIISMHHNQLVQLVVEGQETLTLLQAEAEELAVLEITQSVHSITTLGTLEQDMHHTHQQVMKVLHKVDKDNVQIHLLHKVVVVEMVDKVFMDLVAVAVAVVTMVLVLVQMAVEQVEAVCHMDQMVAMVQLA